MKGITIWQPWAHLVIYGAPDGRRKTWETRREWWLSPARRLVGRRLAIHPAQRRTGDLDRRTRGFGLDPSELAYGALLGSVFVNRTKWLSYYDEPEALCPCDGAIGIGCEHPAALPEPVPWRGQQGIFHVPDAVMAAAELLQSMTSAKASIHHHCTDPLCGICQEIET